MHAIIEVQEHMLSNFPTFFANHISIPHYDLLTDEQLCFDFFLNTEDCWNWRQCLPNRFAFIYLIGQDAGNQQVGFLLGSCGISLALTSEVCLKGLPKTPSGEILQFKGIYSIYIWFALVPLNMWSYECWRKAWLSVYVCVCFHRMASSQMGRHRHQISYETL